MTSGPDEDFERFLRDGLGASPERAPIANLPQRAIARARQSTIARIAQRQRATRRLLNMATLLAGTVIFCILAAGSLSLLGTYGTRDPSATSNTALSQNDGLGFAILAVAIAGVIVAAILRSVADAFDADTRLMTSQTP